MHRRFERVELYHADGTRNDDYVKTLASCIDRVFLVNYAREHPAKPLTAHGQHGRARRLVYTIGR
jgi:hypothetical protein